MFLRLLCDLRTVSTDGREERRTPYIVGLLLPRPALTDSEETQEYKNT